MATVFQQCSLPEALENCEILPGLKQVSNESRDRNEPRDDGVDMSSK